MFGRMLDERLGKWTFWLMFVGFNLTFMPQHFLGLLGMPRRDLHVRPTAGSWETYNLISTIGAGVMAVGVLALLRQRPPLAARHAGRATTRGSATRSSGSRPRRRRRRTSTEPLPYVSSPRPLRDLRAAAEGARCA